MAKTLRDKFEEFRNEGYDDETIIKQMKSQGLSSDDLDLPLEEAKSKGQQRLFVGPPIPTQQELDRRKPSNVLVEQMKRSLPGVASASEFVGPPVPKKEVQKKALPPEWKYAFDPSNPEALPEGVDAREFVKGILEDKNRYSGMRSTERADFVSRDADEEISLPSFSGTKSTQEEYGEASGSTEQQDILRRKDESQKIVEAKGTSLRGGILKPVESAKMLASAAMGAFEGYVDVAKDPEYAQHIQDSIVKATVDSRKETMKDKLSTRLGNDVAKTFMGAIEIISAATVGVPMDTDEDVMEAARQLGINIPNALAGTVRAAVNDPEGAMTAIYETAMAAPITTALTVWPMVGGMSKLAKATGIPSKIAKPLEVPMKNMAKFLTDKVDAFTSSTGITYAREGAKRFFIDSLYSRSPETTALLDDIIEQTAKIEGGFDLAAREGTTEKGLSQLSTRLDEGALQKGATKPLSLKERFDEASVLQELDISPSESTLKWMLEPEWNQKLGELADNANISKLELAKQIMADGGLKIKSQPWFEDVYNDILKNVPKEKLDEINKANKAIGLQAMKTKAIESYIEDALNQVFKSFKDSSDGDNLAFKLLDGDRPSFLRLTPDEFAQLKESIAAIHDSNITQKKPGNLFPDIERKFKDVNRFLDRMTPITVGKTTGFAEPAVVAHIAPLEMSGKIGQYIGEGPGRLVNLLLNTGPKAVALPLNLKAAINNLVGNATMMPLIYGDRIPVVSEVIDIAKYLTRKGKSIAGEIEPEAIRVARRNGLFNNDAITKDIAYIGSTKPGQLPGAIDYVEGGLSKLAETTGKLSVAGDEMSKVHIFNKEYPFMKDLISKMEPNTSTTLRVSPTASIKLTLLEDGSYTASKIANGKLVGQPKVLSSTALEDVVGRYAKNVADNMLFDYGRIPGILKMVRQTPIIGAGSPFFTWSWKALDIPFVKPGVLTNMLNPRAVSSTSSAVNRALGVDAIGIGTRRAGVISSLKHIADEGGYDEDVVRQFSYNPQQRNSILVKAMHDPQQKLIQNFAATSPMEGLVGFVDLAQQMANSVLGENSSSAVLDSIKNLPEGKEERGAQLLALQKRAEELIVKEKDAVPALIKMFGLGGSFIMDEYVKAKTAEKMGETYNIGDALKKFYFPSIVKSLSSSTDEDIDKLWKDVPEGSIPFETAAELMMRNITGFGYRSISSDVAMKRYLTGIEKEAQKIFDVNKLKQKIKTLEKVGQPDSESLEKAYDDLDVINEMINDILSNIKESIEDKNVPKGK